VWLGVVRSPACVGPTPRYARHSIGGGGCGITPSASSEHSRLTRPQRPARASLLRHREPHRYLVAHHGPPRPVVDTNPITHCRARLEYRYAWTHDEAPGTRPPLTRKPHADERVSGALAASLLACHVAGLRPSSLGQRRSRRARRRALRPGHHRTPGLHAPPDPPDPDQCHRPTTRWQIPHVGRRSCRRACTPQPLHGSCRDREAALPHRSGAWRPGE